MVPIRIGLKVAARRSKCRCRRRERWAEPQAFDLSTDRTGSSTRSALACLSLFVYLRFTRLDRAFEMGWQSMERCSAANTVMNYLIRPNPNVRAFVHEVMLQSQLASDPSPKFRVFCRFPLFPLFCAHGMHALVPAKDACELNFC
eukprot:649194-Pleurochrysis_carterae.AAC.3